MTEFTLSYVVQKISKIKITHRLREHEAIFMKLRYTFLAATMMAAPLAAKAQTTNPPPVTGLYVSIGAGINILQGEHLADATGTATDAYLRSRTGPAVVVALGYGLGNGLRVEIEGDYRNNRFSQARDF